jgi:hypothetical protein
MLSVVSAAGVDARWTRPGIREGAEVHAEPQDSGRHTASGEMAWPEARGSHGD